MSFFESYKQEISPEVALLIMPELKEDYIKDKPCKWRERKDSALGSRKCTH